ncbi:hypothetical protein PABG_00872 [Paracoccidioides brasiliensis Pb03]|uniref:Uncharacterized protein n=1 Tax=Paracoccidioides brasiliensis (strain Pb18) TaxID=502780 RepID=C1G830_PARBD|nr:uncharacterized protein PADG_03335 [Paracoccidioides brasiliensis Pb18]EEH18309.1 hypothetical protein PABG_00872 [Paracoccidioides brasiliensis Pb03]EEH47237.2 hypothetical protein PADG_03335 [Paracoccidioides brasiliensis Pb18]ODH48685.1 hypothetical protein GX48_05225 [Paracoccidioides brasiliensis]
MNVESLPAFKVIPYIPSSQNAPLDALLLKLSSSWTYCGPLLNLPNQTLPPSFYTWAEQTVVGSPLPHLIPFLNFVHEFLLKNHLSHYWITIKASQGTHEFDIPRWHTDDLFYSKGVSSPTNQADETKWKLATTILGPGTLFLTSTTRARPIYNQIKQSIRDENKGHICSPVRCVGCATAAETVRQRLAAEFQDHGFIQAAPGECTFFRVGDEEGAVHSEPRCHGDRIFVNVVPGREEELRDLMKKWDMEFPRAWCLDLPLQFGDGSQVRDIWAY